VKLGIKEIESRLRSQGYRLTAPRRAVIEAAVRSEDHLTPAALYEKLRLSRKGIGLVTVYRTLELLESLGLICEVHAGGSCHSYTVGARRHHHHLICSDCGRVVDFESPDLARLRRRLASETGFEIKEELLEFLGQCRSCSEATSSKKVC